MNCITRPPTNGHGPAFVTLAEHLHGNHWDGARHVGWGAVRIAIEPDRQLTATDLRQLLATLDWYDGHFVLAATGRECALAFERAADLGADAIVAWFPPADVVERDPGCPLLVLDAAYRDTDAHRSVRTDVIRGPWAHPDVHTLLPECVLDIPNHHLADPALLAAHWLDGRREAPLPRYFHGVGDWLLAVPRKPRVVDLCSPQPDLHHVSADPYPSVPHSAALPSERTDVWRWTVPAPGPWCGIARLNVRAEPAGSQVVGTLVHRRSDGTGSVLTDAVGEVAANGSCELSFAAAEFAPGPADELVVEITATRWPRHPNPVDGTLRFHSACLELPEAHISSPGTWPVYRTGRTIPSEESANAADDLDTPTSLPVVPPAGDARLRSLVDPRSGLVTSVEPAPDWVGLPDDVHLLSAQVASLDEFVEWPADRIAMGMGFDEATAFNASVGEAIERYCGNFVPAGLRRASWNDMAEAGDRAIDPADLALLTPAQYEAPSCPFEPLTPDLSIEWAAGVDLIDDRRTWAPASLVWVNHHLDRDEPRTHPHNLAGVAAGRDLHDAQRSALEEIIERDSVQIWWLSGLPASGIEFDPELLDSGLTCEGNGWYHHTDLPYRVRAVAIPTTWPVPVVGVYLHHLHLDLHVLGLAARPDPLEAVRKGWLEALALQGYARGLLDPDGDVWNSVETGIFAGHGLKPWRADRGYRAEYAADYHDLLDLACHSQIWLDPAMRTELGPIVSDARPAVSLADLHHPITDARCHYVQAMADKQIRPVSVDVTTPDIAAVGPRVVRVIAPGTYMNTPAGFPLLGGDRLRADAATLGLDHPLTVDDVNFTPLPHT